MGSQTKHHANMQNYIDINSAFTNIKTVETMMEQAHKEKARIDAQMIIAYNAKRSDRHEWKARYESLLTVIKGLEFLKVQILVTSGRVPLL